MRVIASEHLEVMHEPSSNLACTESRTNAAAILNAGEMFQVAIDNRS